MSSSNEKDIKQQAEEFSDTTDAVTCILNAAGCRKSLRQYIDCLIGLAKGRVEFDATDRDIERHRKGVAQQTKSGKKEYWARDKRRDLIEWQMDDGVELLHYKEGKYDSKLKRRPPSHYKLYLVEYVQQVLAKAKQNKLLWNHNRAMAINYEAQKLVNELRKKPKAEPEEKYINPHNEAIKELHSAKRNIEKTIGWLKKYDFQLYEHDEALVDSIEQLIAEIRKRGFAELDDMKIFVGIEREPKP